MRMEARNTILLGIGLIVYGAVAASWESERVRRWRDEFQSSIRADHGRWRRHEMIAEEMNVPEPEPEETGV